MVNAIDHTNILDISRRDQIHDLPDVMMPN